MNNILNAIARFWQSIIFWLLVLPWQEGLRVRAGRWVKKLGPGIHLKLPWIDQVFIQTNRWRVIGVGQQTLRTQDGKAVVVASVIGYRIEDLETLYRTLHNAEGTIKGETRSIIAEYVFDHNLLDCQPAEIGRLTTTKLDLSRYGLAEGVVQVTGFSAPKTYRIITGDDDNWVEGEQLNTNLQAGQEA